VKRTDSIPFKNKKKYVVERKVDGVKTVFSREDGDVVFQPSNSVDNRVASVINDENFVLEGYVSDSCLYVTDVLYYGGEDYRDESWPERYKVLKNNFRWNSAVKLNRPLVVTDKEEMRHALELFNMLPESEGVVVRSYESVYNDEKVFIPSGGEVV